MPALSNLAVYFLIALPFVSAPGPSTDPTDLPRLSFVCTSFGALSLNETQRAEGGGLGGEAACQGREVNNREINSNSQNIRVNPLSWVYEDHYYEIRLSYTREGLPEVSLEPAARRTPQFMAGGIQPTSDDIQLLEDFYFGYIRASRRQVPVYQARTFPLYQWH